MVVYGHVDESESVFLARRDLGHIVLARPFLADHGVVGPGPLSAVVGGLPRE